MIFSKMIAHAQKDAIINITITSLTVSVARAKRPHMEKSISCASASVSASICLLFSRLAPIDRALITYTITAIAGETPTHWRHNAPFAAG
jgi:hypothetical protein